jgi:hypothetical protein
MNKTAIGVLSGVVSICGITLLTTQDAQAYYDAAWSFVCDWECGEAYFEPEYGGYTLHGYASAFHDELPPTESDAYTWAYYDYWHPAGCYDFSTVFAQTVCFDTAYMYGLNAWDYFASLYSGYSDDELACRVIDERSYWRDNSSPYVWGWMNRDAELAAIGGCWG